MGLDIVVGMLADLAESDEEGFATLKKSFDSLNGVLRSKGLPEHREPESADWVSWSAQMYGYSGLHYVRRLGAHLWSGNALPAPWGKDRPEDPVLEAIHKHGEPRASGFFGKLLGKTKSLGRPFEHLIIHSDCEGYYVPIDFERVIFCEEKQAPGGMIGSTQRLKAELEVLAQAVELPLTLDPECEEVWDASDSPSATGPKWTRYGIESFGILRLWHACQLSLKRGAAVVFT